MIKAENLFIKTKRKREVLLQKFDLKCQKGQLTAIMGPSGSGKTTLLDALKNNQQSGLSYSGRLETKGIIKYVAQEDLLHGFFTVRQYLQHYMHLNYSGISTKDRNALVEDIASKTGLKSALDTKVGDFLFKGLLGGQKRRLSIALELVSNPDVLLLDEPTSGLDSLSAICIFEILRDLVINGLCVVCTLHQPSSQMWNQIDQLVLLSKGYTCYIGGIQGAKDFFIHSIGKEMPSTHFNPADFLILQLNSDFNKDVDPSAMNQKFIAWCNTNDDLEANNCINIPDVKKLVEIIRIQVAVSSKQNWAEALRIHAYQRAGGFQKFFQLIQQSMLNAIKNPGIIGVRLTICSILCFMTGFMFFNLESSFNDADVVSRVSFLFAVDALMVLLSVAALPFFLVERRIIEKEVKNQLYSSSCYELARFIISLLGIALISIISSGLSAGIAKLNGFGIFFLTLFLSLMIAECLSFLMGLIVRHYIVGIALLAEIYGIFMICEGFMIVKSKIPGYFIWLHYLAFHTYSFKGFMINEFSSIGSFNSARFSDGKAVLEFYEVNNLEIWQIILILILYIVVLEIISLIVLSVIFRSKKLQ